MRTITPLSERVASVSPSYMAGKYRKHSPFRSDHCPHIASSQLVLSRDEAMQLQSVGPVGEVWNGDACICRRPCDESAYEY